MEDPPPRYVSPLWRTQLRTSGVSLWGERPTWIRHSVYWAITLGVISLTAFDGSSSAASAHASDVAGIVGLIVFIIFIVYAIIGFVLTRQEGDQAGPVRTISRSLVSFTLLIGTLAALLFYARRWGVHIEACRTVGEMETCQGQASPRQVLGLLAWHAANVVPALDITHSLEWQRPARSAYAVVGASIIVVRLAVVIGVLGVFKLLWDKWGSAGSSPPVSR
jgi:hypothetical protein